MLLSLQRKLCDSLSQDSFNLGEQGDNSPTGLQPIIISMLEYDWIQSIFQVLFYTCSAENNPLIDKNHVAGNTDIPDILVL